MRVLVTGGTGFVGSHSVAALRRSGHDVRLLVRSRAKIEPALRPHGTDAAAVDVVEGDCTDAAAVRRAVEGCDALLHCANVFTWAAARQPELVRTNTATTEHVLRLGVEAGLDPVVHVSSIVALLPASEPLTPDSPIGRSTRGYTASKAAAERIARDLQAGGAPVVITYPGGVVGPHDPYLGESGRLVLRFATSRRPPGAGTLGWVDVRDVAAAHAAVMTPGAGARRYVLAGHDVALADVARRVASIAGHRSSPMVAPAPLLRASGRVLDLVGRLPGGARVPISSGAVELLLGYPGSGSDGLGELGVQARPLEETLRDTVAWLREAGHLREHRSAPVPAG